MSSHPSNNANDGKIPGKRKQEASDTPQPLMIAPRGERVTNAQTNLGDSEIQPSPTSNPTSQEAMSVLLLAAMTSEPQESINPSPFGFNGSIPSTLPPPMGHSHNTSAAPERHNSTGNSGPLNPSQGMTVDNIRAAIASQEIGRAHV